jgi:hypothetical protein
MEECSICYEKKRLTTIGPCNHRFCSECLLQQLKFQHKCAMCRSTILACSPPIIRRNHKRVTIHKQKNSNSGMSFGVLQERLIVLSVQKNIKELCPSDIITSINGIHIVSSEWARCVLYESDKLILTVIKYKPAHSWYDKYCPCFSKILPK